MKYKTITIRSGIAGYYVSVSLDSTERVERETLPNPMGHYHYPMPISDEVAFDALRSAMIAKMEEDIGYLEGQKKLLNGLVWGS